MSKLSLINIDTVPDPLNIFVSPGCTRCPGSGQVATELYCLDHAIKRRIVDSDGQTPTL